MYVTSTLSEGLIGGGSTAYFTPNTSIFDGSWHHVVITYLSMSSSATNYYNEVMADDPCLYLRFGDDPNYADSSSNHYWVEYGNATQIVDVNVAGGIGKCIYLPGGGGSYVAAANRLTAPPLPTVGHSHSYAFAPNDITFELWVRSNKNRDAIDPFGFLFNQNIIDNGDPDINAPSLSKNDSDFFIASVPYTNISPVGQAYTTSVGAPLGTFPFDDQWHHIVLVYQTRADNNEYLMEIQWYKDANLIKDKVYPSSNYTGPTLGDCGPEMDHIVIGGRNSRSNVQNRWGGYYDEFAIYGKALTPDRILAHYQAAQPHNCSELWSRGLGKVADRNHDCFFDFYDFASFATDWRKCNDPCDPKCAPNW
jgi:hypothetical protein